MPFVKNSTKNQFSSSYHVPHTLPIKTHKFWATIHPKSTPKIGKYIRPKTLKMQPKNALKREREKGAYLRWGSWSARKRERPERWPDVGERRRERELSAEAKMAKPTRGRKKRFCWAGSVTHETTSFRLNETASFQLNRTTARLLLTDDTSFDHATERQVV